MAAIKKLVAKDIQAVTKVVPVPHLDLGAGTDPDAEIIIKKMNIADFSYRQKLIDQHAVNGKILYSIQHMIELVVAMVDDDGDRIADPSEIEALVDKMDAQTYADLRIVFEELNPTLAVDDAELKEKKSK